MRKLAKNSVAQRWLVASLDEIADMEEEVALKRLPPFQKAHDLKRTETKRNNMTKAESMQKMGLYKVIGSRAGGYAEISNMDEVGSSFYQPSGAGSKAYFFDGEEGASYGEQLGETTWAKRILTLMARTRASYGNDEMPQPVALGAAASRRSLSIQGKLVCRKMAIMFTMRQPSFQAASRRSWHTTCVPYEKREYGGRRLRSHVHRPSGGLPVWTRRDDAWKATKRSACRRPHQGSLQQGDERIRGEEHQS